MSDIYRSAKVFIGSKCAGIISESEDGYVFAYSDEYALDKDSVAVSLTMPLDQRVYESKTLFPFFDGLIPEGWLYECALHNWKLNRNDRFGMLILACKDCIGDVSIRADG